MSDDEVLNLFLSVHQAHKISSVLTDFLKHPPVTALLKKVVGPNVKCMQSMLYIKPAGKPGVAWHQDESLIPTRDRSLTGVWIALDDATRDASLSPPEPEHLGPLYAFLASDLAGAVSGKLFTAAGGYVGLQGPGGGETLLAYRRTEDGPWPLHDLAREVVSRLETA